MNHAESTAHSNRAGDTTYPTQTDDVPLHMKGVDVDMDDTAESEQQSLGSMTASPS